jgi:hypothetical protein
LVPLLIVLIIGVLLILLTVASTALTAVASFFTSLLPGGAVIWQIVNFLISLAVLTVLTALVYKYLPDVKVSWSDLWPGSLLTAILFVVGQFILSWYLGRQSSTSLYGAAGSLIVLLLWVYYSAQIFLFGAEFTQVYATHYGKGVLPDSLAVSREDNTVAQKPAAQAADNGATEPVTVDMVDGETPAHNDRGINGDRAIHSGSAYLAATDVLPVSAAQMPLQLLVKTLLAEGGALFVEEAALARAEFREMAAKVERGVTLLAGGTFSLYAGGLFLLLAVALLLSRILPLWLGLLLVGVLAAIEGWLASLAGRKRLVQLQLYPAHTLESLRQDGETLRKALHQ